MWIHCDWLDVHEENKTLLWIQNVVKLQTYLESVLPRLAPAGWRIVWFFTISTTHLVFSSFSVDQTIHTFTIIALNLTNQTHLLLVFLIIHNVMLVIFMSSSALFCKTGQNVSCNHRYSVITATTLHYIFSLHPSHGGNKSAKIY